MSTARGDGWRFGGPAALIAALLCLTCNYGDVTVIEPAAAPPSDTLSLTVLPGETQAAAALSLSDSHPSKAKIDWAKVTATLKKLI